MAGSEKNFTNYIFLRVLTQLALRGNPNIAEIYIYPRVRFVEGMHKWDLEKLTYNPAMQRYASAEYLRYGRFEELNKILGILKENNGFGIMKLHGELCVGDSLYDAFQKLKGRIEDAK